MKSLQTYRMEHQTLLDRMARLNETLDLVRWKKGAGHAQSLSGAIAALKDEVLAHTYYEDRDFYPWVQSLQEASVVQSVARMREEFFPIDRAFDAFLSLWPAHQILFDLPEFEKSLLELTELLKERIREEEEIFSLLDQLGIEP